VIATAAMFGSGAAGGVFTPTLFVGAALGCLFGMPVHYFWPDGTADPSAYALVGMGCLLAGTTHAPLMAILALFEMTLDYGIVLPLMLACVTAYYTARSIDTESIYSRALKHRKGLGARRALAGGIEDLIHLDPVAVKAEATLGEVVQAFTEHRHSFIYVVGEGGRFLGAISLHDIKAHMADGMLSKLLIASELMDPDFPFIERSTSLAQALEQGLAQEWQRIPVVENRQNRRLVGTVSKSDLLLELSLEPGASA